MPAESCPIENTALSVRVLRLAEGRDGLDAVATAVDPDVAAAVPVVDVVVEAMVDVVVAEPTAVDGEAWGGGGKTGSQWGERHSCTPSRFRFNAGVGCACLGSPLTGGADASLVLWEVALVSAGSDALVSSTAKSLSA